MNINSNFSALIQDIDHSHHLKITQTSKLSGDGKLQYPGPRAHSLISATSLKGKVKPNVPQTAHKSSEISFKKLFFAAAAIMGAGVAAAYVYNRSAANRYAGCVDYYKTPVLGGDGTFVADFTSFFHDVKNTVMEPLERKLCGTEAVGRALTPKFAEGGSLAGELGDLSKLNSNLLNDEEYLKAIINNQGRIDILDFLGDKLTSNPEKLMNVLRHAHWEKRQKPQNGDNFYENHLHLLDKIPYKTKENFCLGSKGNDGKFSEGMITLYPKKHLSAFYKSLNEELQTNPKVLIELFSRAALTDVYDQLSDELKANEDIAIAYIQNADQKSFETICKQFPDSHKVAFAAYRRNYKEYESTSRHFFSKETQKSEELKKNVQKLECPTSGPICDWDTDKTRVQRFLALSI